MRPKYVMSALALGEGSPHQFNADLHLVDWLHHGGYACDVATDEDLHREGAALLARYQVILTGTHHEYWSQAMLDAMAGYLERGGRLMYLAGNGFYWVTELDRVDHALGSPYDTIVLATASGFSDAYQHVSEEVTVADSRQGGTVNPLVKADMVLRPSRMGARCSRRPQSPGAVRCPAMATTTPCHG